jgi:hypothetical protein
VYPDHFTERLAEGTSRYEEPLTLSASSQALKPEWPKSS